MCWSPIFNGSGEDRIFDFYVDYHLDVRMKLNENQTKLSNTNYALHWETMSGRGVYIRMGGKWELT